MFYEYILITKYLIISLIFVIILMSVSGFLVYQEPESEKLTAYECGFNPYGDARSKFEIRFYLVGVLFLIFDLELSFLFPFVVTIDSIGYYGIMTMLWFLGILTLGFWYEWKRGALEWD